jgi:hypothetical protein
VHEISVRDTYINGARHRAAFVVVGAEDAEAAMAAFAKSGRRE